MVTVPVGVLKKNGPKIRFTRGRSPKYSESQIFDWRKFRLIFSERNMQKLKSEWHHEPNDRYYLIQSFQDSIGNWIILRYEVGGKKCGYKKVICSMEHSFIKLKVKKIEIKLKKNGFKKMID